MAKKLYVGGLPYSTTEDELKTVFEPYGQLESVRIVTDRFTGKSRGFGFVEMIEDEEAQKAIDELNGKELGGRSMTVNEARPPKPREHRGGGGGGGFRGDRRGGRGGPGGGGGGRHRGGGGGGGGPRW